MYALIYYSAIKKEMIRNEHITYCKKTAAVLETVIGISLAICLFIGAVGLIAFIAGGETAALICEYMYKVFYVWLMKLSTITTIACFILQYLKGDTNRKNPVKYWRYKLNKKMVKDWQDKNEQRTKTILRNSKHILFKR